MNDSAHVCESQKSAAKSFLPAFFLCIVNVLCMKNAAAAAAAAVAEIA